MAESAHGTGGDSIGWLRLAVPLSIDAAVAPAVRAKAVERWLGSLLWDDSALADSSDRPILAHGHPAPTILRVKGVVWCAPEDEDEEDEDACPNLLPSAADAASAATAATGAGPASPPQRPVPYIVQAVGSLLAVDAATGAARTAAASDACLSGSRAMLVLIGFGLQPHTHALQTALQKLFDGAE
jgi:hypothetical protein